MAEQMLKGCFFCPFCQLMVTTQSSLNRHYGCCKLLKETIEKEPESVDKYILNERDKQLKLVQDRKDKLRNNQDNRINAAVYISCSQCGDCLITREKIIEHVCKKAQ